MGSAINQQTSVETTNFKKFQTGNPVVRRLIDNFYEKVGSTISPLQPSSVLDAGCGEGESLDRLASILPDSPNGIDLNPESVEFASRRMPDADLRVGDLTAMEFADESFDLILCLEVLEHLPNPAVGLSELARVSSKDVVISVPHEPWFRLGSLARGNYVKNWGNHPEHVNHWDGKSLRAFLEAEVDVVNIKGTMPWLIAHCRVRG